MSISTLSQFNLNAIIHQVISNDNIAIIAYTLALVRYGHWLLP